MKKFLIPLILFGLAVATALSGYIFLIYLQKPKTADILVASRDISVGSTLTPEDISSIPWVGKKLPEGFIQAVDINKVKNRVTAVDIVRGTPIVERSLAPLGSVGGLLAKIPNGQRALTVKVDEVSGVAGFSKPGCRVDVLLAGAGSDEQGKEEKSAKIILQNVLVLAAGQRVTQIEGKEKPEVVHTVTLLVSPEESEKLALASKMGTLLLTLRPGGDIINVATNGVRPDEVWGPPKELALTEIELILGGKRGKIRLQDVKEMEKEEDKEKEVEDLKETGKTHEQAAIAGSL
jgi:pilus assembly protein CpaB